MEPTMTTEQRLRIAFRDALDLEPDTDPASLYYRSHPNWDSLGHMSLVVRIEEEFGIEIDSDQLMEIDSFEAALKVLREAGIDG